MHLQRFLDSLRQAQIERIGKKTIDKDAISMGFFTHFFLKKLMDIAFFIHLPCEESPHPILSRTRERGLSS
jgi:hypothetical protein